MLIKNKNGHQSENMKKDAHPLKEYEHPNCKKEREEEEMSSLFFGRKVEVGDYDAVIVGRPDCDGKYPVIYNTVKGEPNVYWISKDKIVKRGGVKTK